MRGSKDAMVRSQNGVMVQKRVGPGKRAEKREKREERRERQARPRSVGPRMQWFDPRMAGWYRKGSVPRSKDAMVRSQNGGMVQKRVGP